MLIVAPATASPGPTSTGTGSPVSIDWSTADEPSTTTPSVAIFSPGRTTKRSPTASSLDRDEHLLAVAEHARLLRAELEQGADRLARAAAGAGLEVAAEQDQRRDHGGDLEVRVARRCRRRGRPSTSARRRACRPRSACPSSRRRGAAFRSAARWNGQPAQNTTGRRERERDPLPAVELERRHHRDQRRAAPSERPRRRAACRTAPGRRPVPSASRHSAARRGSRSPRRSRSGRRRDTDAGSNVTDACLGRVVDGRLDAVELVQLALDPRGARGARHALEVEPDASRSRGSRPPSGCLVPGFLDRGADRRVVEAARPAHLDALRLEVDGRPIRRRAPPTPLPRTAASQCAQCIPGTRYCRRYTTCLLASPLVSFRIPYQGMHRSRVGG